MINSLNRTGTWRTYSMADGLAGMCVEHIAEDSEGYLWFATWDNGVSRFDGDEFQNFTLQDGLLSDHIYFIFQDSQGRLWFGTLNGVCWYDGSNFHHLGDDGIAGRAVQFIYEDREGHIWFGGHRTLGYYDGTMFHDLVPLYLQHYEPLPFRKQCRGIAQDPEGHLWFGFDYLIRFDGESFHRYEEKEGFPLQWISYVVGQDDTGEVWVGQHQHQDRLCRYVDGNFQPIQNDLGDPLRRILCDREGRMWLCTSNGVLYQDKDGFSKFIPADGLPHPAVKAVFQDRDHQYWFATWGGVGLYDIHSISFFDTQECNKFIGQSTALHQFQTRLREVASTDITVLILGETGVGKGLAARVLHEQGSHSDGPFIQVNSGALPEMLIDSELFGHEKGAFASAVSRRLGKVELAKGGTLFLDETGDMTLEMQAKLLRLLEEGTFERVGGSEILTAQTRIVASTNRNLEEMVNTGAFREDLYYRIYGFPLYLPPLRERKEDIPDLAEFFKDRTAAHIGKQIAPLTAEIIEVLQSYDWPGNVRELEHAIQRAVTVCQGSRIALEDLGSYRSRIAGAALDLVWTSLSDYQDREIVPLGEFERLYILEVLKTTNWKVKGAEGAAARLELPPSTLYSRMKKLGIKRP